MKTFLMSLLAAALTVGTAAAQTGPPEGMARPDGGRMQGNPDEMAKRQTDRMTQELGLSADQSAKVRQIMLARGQEMQAMRGQGRETATASKMREQMQASRTKYDAQFKDVLTADQFTKYTTMEANRMNRGGWHGGKGGKMKAKSKDGAK